MYWQQFITYQIMQESRQRDISEALRLGHQSARHTLVQGKTYWLLIGLIQIVWLECITHVTKSQNWWRNFRVNRCNAVITKNWWLKVLQVWYQITKRNQLNFTSSINNRHLKRFREEKHRSGPSGKSLFWKSSNPNSNFLGKVQTN